MIRALYISLSLLVLSATLKADELQEGRQRLLDQGCTQVVFATRGGQIDGHWYANIGYYAFDKNKKLYASGAHLAILDVKSGGTTILLEDKTGTIRDPAVHYDAEKILFSYRKGTSENFHLFEINIDGSNLKQLTSGAYDDYEPSYLPDDGIVFVSTRAKRWVNCWLTQVGTIHKCQADGSNIQALSPNLEHDNTPWALPDGRIMYQRWEYIDRSQIQFHHLWTMKPDGTEQMIYFGNMHPGGVLIDAKPVPDSNEVILINSPGHGRPEHAGEVILLSDKYGPDHQSSKKVLTPKNFRDPYALSKDVFFAAQGRHLVTLTRDGKRMKAFTLGNTRFGPHLGLHEPRPIIKHAREKVLPSRIDKSKATGTMLLTSVYIGRKMGSVKKGSVKKLLIMEALPKPINFTGGMDPLTYGGSFTLERVLGTVPVEEDGSAFFNLPADRSVFFIALDEKNGSVKRMHSFTSVRPGETVSCIGCHENRTTVPSLSSSRPMAASRPASDITKVPGIPEVFDFPRDIQPILDKHCVSCHNPAKREGRVLMTGDHGPMFSHSYFMLTIHRQFADGRNRAGANYDPYVIGAASSPLMKKLRGEHYGATLSEKEITMIRYWIEAAATYPGTYAALGTGMIGGYQQNQKVINNDSQWDTSITGREVIKRRCESCHTGKTQLPRSMSDEQGMSFWQPRIGDVKLQSSRHILFNLSTPANSIMLLAPLAKEAGGYDSCKDIAADDPLAIFKNTSDEDYKTLLKMITAGKEKLEEVTRFDMPDFKPHPAYVREMKRFGVLPESFDPIKDDLDPYVIDQRYWKSHWHRSPGN